MSIIKKYSYIRAIIVGLPFGFAAMFQGISLFKELPNVNELIKEEGLISKVENKIERDGERVYDFVEITLNNKKFRSGEYKDDILNKLDNYASYDSSVIIWHERGKYSIKQLVYGDILIVEYKPPYWIAIFFLSLGVITLLSALIYVIKHPEDLISKKRS